MASERKRRRILGPLTYVTLIGSVLIYGCFSIPQWLKVQYRCRSLYHELQQPWAGSPATAAELEGMGAAAGFWSGLALRNSNPRVREIACGLIVNTTPEPSEAISRLIAAAEDSDPKVREAAIEELVESRRQHGLQIPKKLRERTIEIFRTGLKDHAMGVRLAAATAMSTAWTFEDVLPDLRAAMLDPEPKVRFEAGFALYVLEPDRDKKTQILRTIFEDPNIQDDQGCLILSTLLDDAGLPSVLENIAAMLRSRDPKERDKAIAALWFMRTQLSLGKSGWARSLGEFERGPHWYEHSNLETLCSKEILDGLTKLLKKPGFRNRLNVLELLSNPPFQERFDNQSVIEPALISLVGDRETFRLEFPYGLDRMLLMHPEVLPEAVLIVARHLDDPELMVRRMALDLLGLLGADSLPAVPKLLEFWEKEPLYRAQVRSVLSKIDPTSIEKLDAPTTFSDHTDMDSQK